VTVELTERDMHHPRARTRTARSMHSSVYSSTAIARLPRASWGLFPALALSSSVALLLIALADTAARVGMEGAELLFWIGVLGLFVPIMARTVAPAASRQERIALVTVLGMGTYLIKVLHSPLRFTFSDEFAHWRTVIDIAASGHIFGNNPLLPVTALYPGMALIMAALTSVTGLPVFGAGLVLLGCARLVLVLSLFHFFEHISGSARVAGLGTVLYMANPNYVFFMSQYAYESLALPLALFTLYCLVLRSDSRPKIRVGAAVFAVMALGAVIITHHLTSYALVALLVFWTAVARLFPRHIRQGQPAPNRIALFGMAAAACWFMLVASYTASYLMPHLIGGALELARLIAGEQGARQLFRGYSGEVAPLWERAIGYGSVAIILFTLPFGIVQVWQWHRQRVLAIVLVLASLAYPASLAFRLTQRGAEASNRSSEFVFLAVAFVLAVAATEKLWLMRVWLSQVDWRRTVVFVAGASAMFIGGITVGFAPWARLPGPYLVTADMRSIEPEGIAAAEWMRNTLGPGNRIAADRTNRLLSGSLGNQRTVTSYGDGITVANVFFALRVGPTERAILQRGEVRYLIVDKRLSQSLPRLGAYYERGEPGSGFHQTPMDPAVLAKFDAVPGVHRVFDSGNIVIYDVGAIIGAR
jgi:hypothetical protein